MKRVKIRYGEYSETPFSTNYAQAIIVNVSLISESIIYGTDDAGNNYTFGKKDILEHIE
jgi:hypothetical protein